ncbi:MAG: M20/M25/M40 family metallo-hydrolase [Candidatus Altiarchaeota archaeon]
MSTDEEIAKELTELAKKLISFKTTENHPEEILSCVDFVEEYLSESANLQITRGAFEEKPYLIATLKDTKSPKIFLCGHLDVVDAGEEEFNPQIRNGKLFGRGAIDMKGNCAAMMKVMKEISKKSPPPSVGLMLTTDEESGGRHTVDHLLSDEGYSCEAAFVPDGGYGFKLVTAEKGAIWVKLTIKGKAGHGSRPWTGVNAIEKAFDEFKKVKGLFPEIKDESEWAPTVNLGKISSGDAVNKIPDKAVLELDIRYTQEREYEDTVSALKAAIEGDVEITKHTPLCVTKPDNPFLSSYKKTAERILGREMQYLKSAGGSDGKFFGKQGIAVIETCPIGGNHHGRGEWVDLKSLIHFYDILKTYLSSYA